MVTGFDYLSHDKVLQQHWLRRFVALFLDAVIVIVPFTVLLSIVGLKYVSSGLLASVVFFLYASFFDIAIGGTIGKIVMHMKAVSVSGQLSGPQAFMRNLTKIFWPLLLLDWIIGMAIDTNDPRQKWTDRLAGTSVMVFDHPGGT
jgi:uncharacterized RDD family membrane protein YckC